MIRGNIPHKKITFPAGEMHVVLDLHSDEHLPNVTIEWNFENNDELVELMLYCDALRQTKYWLSVLTIPYFPFSRQDRVAVPGDAFSLKVISDIVNSLNADKVITYDAHSDVLPALVKNLHVIKQEDIFAPMINAMGDKISLISPDGGALKKIYKLAAKITSPVEVIECSKYRDPKTGDIRHTNIFVGQGWLNGSTCVIVDDICDGGKTFVEIAKTIREHHSPKKIILMVTHGLFTKGTGVFSGLIDEIYTRDGRYATYNPNLIKEKNERMSS